MTRNELQTKKWQSFKKFKGKNPTNRQTDTQTKTTKRQKDKKTKRQKDKKTKRQKDKKTKRQKDIKT